MPPIHRRTHTGGPSSIPSVGSGVACISAVSQEIPFHSNIISFYGLPFTYLEWL